MNAAEAREILKPWQLYREFPFVWLNFLAHDHFCIRQTWQAGEPTEDGGYRSKYGDKWYESRPIDKTPKCDCGLDEAYLVYLEAIKKSPDAPERIVEK